ncbi:putative holin-like toxin [Scopulibacillus darangshiensis]
MTAYETLILMISFGSLIVILMKDNRKK